MANLKDFNELSGSQNCFIQLPQIFNRICFTLYWLAEPLKNFNTFCGCGYNSSTDFHQGLEEAKLTCLTSTNLKAH